MHHFRELHDRWCADADTLSRYGLREPEAVLRRCLDDLHKYIEKGENDLVTVAAAAQLSGYGPDHLRRMVREQRLRNEGSASRIMLRRRDLPTKPRRANSVARDGAALDFSKQLSRDIRDSKHGDY